MSNFSDNFKGCFSMFFNKELNNQKFTISESKVISSGGRIEFNDSAAAEFAKILGRIIKVKAMPFAVLEVIAKLLNESDQDLTMLGYGGDSISLLNKITSGGKFEFCVEVVRVGK